MCDDHEDSEGSGHGPEEVPDSGDDATRGLDQGAEDDQPSKEVNTNPAPVPAPRLSFHSTDRLPLLPAEKNEESETDLVNLETSRDGLNSHNPPGFLYKVGSTKMIQVAIHSY